MPHKDKKDFEHAEYALLGKLKSKKIEE